MISSVEIAWFAGLLEGEGYFATENTNTRGQKKRYPSIVIAMSDRDVIQRCADLLGTKVSELRPRRPHHKPTYRCLVRGSGAIEWMKLVLPYMGERRSQKINEIISEWEATPMLAHQSRIKRNNPKGFLDTSAPQLIQAFAEGQV